MRESRVHAPASRSLPTRPRYPHDTDLVLPHLRVPHILWSAGRWTSGRFRRQRRWRRHGDHDGDLNRLWRWSWDGWWSRRVIAPRTSREHIRSQRRSHTAYRAAVPPPWRLRCRRRVRHALADSQFRPRPDERRRYRLYALPHALVRRTDRRETSHRLGMRPRLREHGAYQSPSAASARRERAPLHVLQSLVPRGPNQSESSPGAYATSDEEEDEDDECDDEAEKVVGARDGRRG